MGFPIFELSADAQIYADSVEGVKLRSYRLRTAGDKPLPSAFIRLMLVSHGAFTRCHGDGSARNARDSIFVIRVRATPSMISRAQAMTYQTVFVLMVVVWSFSLAYPWGVRWPFARIAIHAPWLLVMLLLLYEQRMPTGMNIRVDLLLIIPALVLAFVIYMWRLFMFSRRSRGHRNSEQTEN